MLRGVGFGWSGVVEEDEGGYEWREPRFELSNAVWRRERQREEERNFHSSILLIIKKAKRKGCLTLRKNCLFFH